MQKANLKNPKLCKNIDKFEILPYHTGIARQYRRLFFIFSTSRLTTLFHFTSSKIHMPLLRDTLHIYRETAALSVEDPIYRFRQPADSFSGEFFIYTGKI